MGEFENKVKGAAKEAAGKAQQAWGEATNQPDHSAEGEARETEGKVQRKIGEAQGGLKDAARNVEDKIRGDR
jgi:uncharacterized protein YjbJ (UPF0337 family)